jgi:hypothetical protein
MTAQTTNRYRQANTREQSRTRSALATRSRMGAISLAISGILFVLYPAIRPFSSEKGLDGAAAFGSSHWIVAHMLAMVGFTLLVLGLVGWHSALQSSPIEGSAFRAFVVTLAAIGLTLPFYGGEAYGLHAIGQEALKRGDGSLVDMSTVVRGGAGLMMFLTGLLLLGIGAIMVARVIWKSGEFAKWSGIPFAIAFALYIPQFFGTQPLRVAHGLLVAAGCAWIAIEMWRSSAKQEQTPS